MRALTRAIEATGAADGFGVLTATIDGDLCGVVTRRPELAGEGVVGLGPETDLGQLDSSFELANRALETAVAFSYEGVVAMEDLSLRPAILAEGHLGERLISRYLDPLHELGEFGATLETTVREYLDRGMRIDESAKALFVHPNTLRHRLDRFQQLTGADLRNTQDVLEIWWALERRRLDGQILKARVGG
jgi:putative transposase